MASIYEPLARLLQGRRGCPVRITYDADPGAAPRAGDVLKTKRERCWLVLHARGVRSKRPNRWALDVLKIDHDEGRRVLPLRWYPRGRKRCGRLL